MQRYNMLVEAMNQVILYRAICSLWQFSLQALHLLYLETYHRPKRTMVKISIDSCVYLRRFLLLPFHSKNEHYFQIKLHNVRYSKFMPTVTTGV